MKEMELLLSLRHVRVLPKIFMLLERLGVYCLDMQGQLQPGTGGSLKLVLSCPAALSARVKTQLARMVDVTELRESLKYELAHAQAYAGNEEQEFSTLGGGNL